jgi:hypothetical protein
MKCKHCDTTTEKLSELKAHFKSAHAEAWAKFNKAMAEYDAAHEHELGTECPICPHRKRTITRGQI